MDMGYEAEDKWRTEQKGKIGEYDNPDNGCPNCGRHRIMKGEDGKHRCEKCSWCIEDEMHDYDLLDYLS